MTKRPQVNQPDGVTYFGHVLVPTSYGFTQIITAAHEGTVTGARDTLVALQTGTPGPSEWFGDPYGYPLHEKGLSAWTRLFGASRFQMPPARTPYNLSDRREHDPMFPQHPLSRVRETLKLLAAGCRIVPARAAGDKEEPGPQEPARLGFTFTLPLGFFPFRDGALRDGRVYRRETFDGRLTRLTLCRHPEAPDSGRSVRGARAMIASHMEMSRSRVFWGPEVREQTVGGRRGICTELESETQGRLIVASCFYFPAGQDSMEVTCMAEIDDRERAARNVSRVLSTLRPLR